MGLQWVYNGFWENEKCRKDERLMKMSPNFLLQNQEIKEC